MDLHSGSLSIAPAERAPGSFGPDVVPSPDSAGGAEKTGAKKACDRCRNMKLKCDGVTPTCNRCSKHRMPNCAYTHEGSIQRQKRHVRDLEARLQRMESILKSAGIISHSEEMPTDSSLDTRIRNLLDATNAKDNLPKSGRQETHEGQKVLIDHWRLAGLPAPLFCHDASKNLMQQMLEITSIDNVDRDMFSSTAVTPLPPREEVYAMVDDYFVHSNSMLPLYHRLTFMRHLDRYYSGELYGRSGWWASLNSVLAVSCMLRARTPRKALFFEDQEVRAWAYMKNAMSVYSELAMVNVDLFSAQALIGMANFFATESRHRQSTAFMDAAVRILHSLGVHKSKSYANVNPVEMEQRRRIFWIAYTYDKEFGLRSGQPLMQVDDDVDIDLPTEQPNYPMGCATTNLGLVPKDGEFSIFRGKCTLAIIKSKIYQRLYSTQSWRKTKKEISATVAQLARELDDWKATLPYALHPDHNMGNLPPSFMIFALSMRFAYYHCVTALHRRLWAYHQTENNPPDALGSGTSPSDPQLVRSAQSCVQAARQTIQLLQILPEGWEVFYHHALYYAVSSYMILFAHLLQNPKEPTSWHDLERMRSAHRFAQKVCSNEKKNGRVQKFISVMEGCDRIIVSLQKESSEERTIPVFDPMLSWGQGMLEFAEFGF